MFSCGGPGVLELDDGRVHVRCHTFQQRVPWASMPRILCGRRDWTMAIHGNVNVFQSGKVALEVAVFGVFCCTHPKDISGST